MRECVCFGCDSSAVLDQLNHVKRITASRAAFAALLEDGSVVTWGEPFEGAEAVQSQLQNVLEIQAAGFAFAAFLATGLS